MSPENKLDRSINHNTSPHSFEEIAELLLSDRACFHSERDRLLASNILVNLNQRVAENLVSPEVYQYALDSLYDLIPRRNAAGLRVIADVVLTPQIEGLVRSRIEAKEINLTGPVGVWGMLPDFVKQEITNVSPMIIEMTDKCTVGCYFCGGSQKGPITEKISFASLIELFTYFRNHHARNAGTYIGDRLFRWTDSFDVKWQNGQNSDLNVLDVAKRYWQLFGKEKSSLALATAIPVGEELRVLEFADYLLTGYETGQISPFNTLCLSLKQENRYRITAIGNILDALHDTVRKVNERTMVGDILLTPLRDGSEILAGSRWPEPGKGMVVTLHDIIGIYCEDGIVIRPGYITNFIVEAGSNERRSGESYIPLYTIRDAGTEFSLIPFQFHNLDLTSDDLPDLYSNPKLIKIRIVGSDASYSQEFLELSSHRALLRLAIGLYFLEVKRGGIENMTPKDRDDYQNKFSRDLDIVWQYLVKTNYGNTSMNVVMKFLLDNGLIK